jgi:hypothetical protein
MTDQDRFADYLNTLRARVSDRCIAVSEDSTAAPPAGWREDAFTAVVLETLEDLGQIAGGEICFFERKMGKAFGKVNAWYLDEENGEVDLFATLYRGLDEPATVTATDLTQVIKRALRVFSEARNGFHGEMEPASPTYDMMQRLHEVWPTVDRLRVIVIADGIASKAGISPVFDWKGPALQVDIWDLQRLYRAASSGLPYEATEIDLVERFGQPLPCLEMPESSADYRSFLAIIPGTLLHSLYHEFGARLLELNVRSFLQARGKVNRGIRDTLKTEPARFLAYNNGISATAESVQLVREEDGRSAIEKITGLQIVNGGQTVASIHRAKERDKADLSEVYVQAKITLVRPEHIETLVPLISRCANTQNRVNEADFSANHAFHIRIQQLSDTIWAPGEQSRWFYERARGQYQVARAKEGDTLGKLRRFDASTPANQRFDKVELAKYLTAWEQLPHIVSRGAQKNFVHFMDRLARAQSETWLPGPEYYRALIAKALIFHRAEQIARSHAFPGYRANAVAYTVALVSYRTAGRVDLEGIWNAQQVSTALADTMYDWMPLVYEQIIVSAGTRNVTEWAKKEECWHRVQTVPVTLSPQFERELSEGQPLPNVGESAGRRGENLSTSDRENIARVMQVPAEEWINICGWGSRNNTLLEWQIGIATTLASYAATGWTKVPSRKQALQGVEILRIAEEGNGRSQPIEGDDE